MKTILKAEKAVRTVVFKSLWKAFDVKDLTDLAMLGLFISILAAITFVVLV
jgi:hypothetical protein